MLGGFGSNNGDSIRLQVVTFGNQLLPGQLVVVLKSQNTDRRTTFRSVWGPPGTTRRLDDPHVSHAIPQPLTLLPHLGHVYDTLREW